MTSRGEIKSITKETYDNKLEPKENGWFPSKNMNFQNGSWNKENINRPLGIEKLEMVLKSLSLEKTPGLHGFIAEC